MSDVTIRILVVDDSISVQRAAREAFAEVSGVDVIVYGDGEGALEWARANQADLALCDLVLPGLSGYDLCRRLLADGAGRSLPVLFLRNAFEPYDESLGRQCGAQGFIPKPFTQKEIRERIGRLLDLPGGRLPAGGPTTTSRPPVAATGNTIPRATVETVSDEILAVDAISEADLVDLTAPAQGDEEPRSELSLSALTTADLIRDLVEPLAAQLMGPLTRHIEEQLESGSLRQSVRRAVREVAERLIRQRIQELEDEARGNAAPED